LGGGFEKFQKGQVRPLATAVKGGCTQTKKRENSLSELRGLSLNEGGRLLVLRESIRGKRGSLQAGGKRRGSP